MEEIDCIILSHKVLVQSDAVHYGSMSSIEHISYLLQCHALLVQKISQIRPFIRVFSVPSG
jgi:hypothetical protein